MKTISVALAASIAILHVGQAAAQTVTYDFFDNAHEIILSGTEETSSPSSVTSSTGAPRSQPKLGQIVPDTYISWDILDRASCGPGMVGVEYLLISRDTGEIIQSNGLGCEVRPTASTPAPAPRPAPVVAAAPVITYTMVRDAARARLPAQPITWSPNPNGLTGLQSLFWYDDDANADTPPRESVSLSITLLTVGAQIELTATRYCWSVDGEPGHEKCRDRAGTRASPALHWDYERSGTRDIVLDVTWEGTYTVTGKPTEAISFDVHYERAYQVDQARSVHTG